jgi:hypothetical protein
VLNLIQKVYTIIIKMDLLPEYESDPEEESFQGGSKSKKKHVFQKFQDYDDLEDAQEFLRQKGYAYDYRVKGNPATDRKVKI